MRKLISVFLAAALLMAVAVLPVSAATYFKVSISNTASTVAVGEKLEITVTVDGVSSGKALSAIEFNLSYNPGYLKPVYTQNEAGDTTRFVATPSGSEWEHIIADRGTSFYCMLSTADGGNNEYSCIGSGDKLSFVLLFEVLDAANGKTVNIGINSAVGYDITDGTLESPLSGSASGYSFAAALPTKPIANIGAKINTLNPALRLGAEYNSAYLGSVSASSIKDIGILVCPTKSLGSAELTTSTSGAKKLTATLDGATLGNISSYKSFEFYITISNIPADEMDTEYSFRAYIDASGSTILSTTTCTRSYSYVYDVLFPSVGTAPGDNVIYPGTGWFE